MILEPGDEGDKSRADGVVGQLQRRVETKTERKQEERQASRRARKREEENRSSAEQSKAKQSKARLFVEEETGRSAPPTTDTLESRSQGGKRPASEERQPTGGNSGSGSGVAALTKQRLFAYGGGQPG